MGNGRKATWVRKIMSFYHISTKYKGNFSWKVHGSLDSATVIYFSFSENFKLWEYSKFYDIWFSAPAVTEKKGC